ncbi:hypothetical protein HFN80_05725 [Rhizobium laguerreae]|uniref:hypothetical protein n=1 Tax=Rhizobium laguerreae TaxID=1076926 RepID=UPI00103E1B78|nr:hypothetical protein [Rhizobium laguerreae]MBY3463513.1 hypothetical protein [Rhizobium laguerreae]TBY03424.1 hypothetical protein E0J21_24435 [Rhizobium laguerreae]
MLDSQSAHFKALDSADLSQLQAILDAICIETGQSLREPEAQEVAAVLISLYRHGVADQDKLLSVGRLALTRKRSR